MSDALERGAWLRKPAVGVAIMAALTAYVIVAGVDRAARRPFWHDEVFTVAIAESGSIRSIWSALSHAVDTNPPGYYVLAKLASAFASDPHVGYRLSSVLGCALAAAALFVLLRRTAPLAALIAAVLILLSPVCSLYSVEARPYSLLVAAIAWAMVVWQQIRDPWRAVLLGALLTVALSLHYFAVLAVAAFCLAELGHTLETRKIRWSIWAALTAASLTLVLYWPLISISRAVYGAAYWAPPRLLQVISLHDAILGVWSYWGTALAIALSVGLIVRIVRQFRDRHGSPEGLAPQLLLLGLINMPAMGYVMSRIVGGGLVPRYVLPSLLGMSVALAQAVWRRGSGVSVTILSILLLVFGLREVDYWRSRPPRVASPNPDNASLRSLVESSLYPGLPAVVSNGITFLPMAFYASRDGLPRPTYLADIDAAVTFAGSDSVDAALDLLAPVMGLDVVPRARFVEQHSRFLIYSHPDRWDWLHAKLSQDGFRIQPIAVLRSPHTRILYLAER